MDQNKKITVVINHKDILIDAIKKFNKLHDIDFELIEFIKDEVNFAYIGYQSATESDVFNLGFQFGKLIMYLRNKGEISN